MRCIDVKNQNYKDGICDKSSNNCTCDDLEGGKEYKILFITTKLNLYAVFDNIKNQFTSMKKYFYL
jgi:hypothetical protein